MCSWIAALFFGYMFGQWFNTQSQMVNVDTWNPNVCQDFAALVLPYETSKQIDLCADIVSFVNGEKRNPNERLPIVTRREICANVCDIMEEGNIPYKMVPYAKLYTYNTCICMHTA